MCVKNVTRKEKYLQCGTLDHEEQDDKRATNARRYYFVLHMASLCREMVFLSTSGGTEMLPKNHPTPFFSAVELYMYFCVFYYGLHVGTTLKEVQMAISRAFSSRTGRQ